MFEAPSPFGLFPPSVEPGSYSPMVTPYAIVLSATWSNVMEKFFWPTLSSVCSAPPSAGSLSTGPPSVGAPSPSPSSPPSPSAFSAASISSAGIEPSSTITDFYNGKAPVFAFVISIPSFDVAETFELYLLRAP